MKLCLIPPQLKNISIVFFGMENLIHVVWNDLSS